MDSDSTLVNAVDAETTPVGSANQGVKSGSRIARQVPQRRPQLGSTGRTGCAPCLGAMDSATFPSRLPAGSMHFLISCPSANVRPQPITRQDVGEFQSRCHFRGNWMWRRIWDSRRVSDRLDDWLDAVRRACRFWTSPSSSSLGAAGAFLSAPQRPRGSRAHRKLRPKMRRPCGRPLAPWQRRPRR